MDMDQIKLSSSVAPNVHHRPATDDGSPPPSRPVDIGDSKDCPHADECRGATAEECNCRYQAELGYRWNLMVVHVCAVLTELNAEALAHSTREMNIGPEQVNADLEAIRRDEDFSWAAMRGGLYVAERNIDDYASWVCDVTDRRYGDLRTTNKRT